MNVKKTKSLRPRISEGEEVMFGNERINQVDNFTYLVALLVGMVKAVKMLKVEQPSLRLFYHS